jgi:hypothetical protein
MRNSQEPKELSVEPAGQRTACGHADSNDPCLRGLPERVAERGDKPGHGILHSVTGCSFWGSEQRVFFSNSLARSGEPGFALLFQLRPARDKSERRTDLRHAAGRQRPAPAHRLARPGAGSGRDVQRRAAGAGGVRAVCALRRAERAHGNPLPFLSAGRASPVILTMVMRR